MRAKILNLPAKTQMCSGVCSKRRKIVILAKRNCAALKDPMAML